MNKIFADIGELGWTMYLSAHVKWLKEQGEDDITVYTTRRPFFPECKTLPIPDGFYSKFSGFPPGSFGRFGLAEHEIRDFFKEKGIILSDSIRYCYFPEILDKTIYRPYPIKSKFAMNDLVVFPRCRDHPNFSFRNLPKKFYESLMKALCEEFIASRVISVGRYSEAYNIKLYHANYLNMVGNTSIQDLIDICTNAYATVGGTSAPPKLALLQGTPSYIIGHERYRFVEEENWMKTRVGFWEIKDNEYNTFEDEKCIESIISWIKSL